MDFTDKLCSSSDKHCDEVKAYVLKRMSSKLSRDKDKENEEKDTTEQCSKGNQHQSKFLIIDTYMMSLTINLKSAILRFYFGSYFFCRQLKEFSERANKTKNIKRNGRICRRTR